MHSEDIPRAARPVVAIYGQESENEALATELALDGYDVRQASEPAMLGVVDLIVFGRASQRGAGLDVLRAVRAGGLAGTSGARVLWTSRSSDDTDTLRAFEAGADDVIRAPFVYAELLARVRALLRRDLPAPALIRHGALEIDTARRTVTYGGRPVGLRRLEYLLLTHLARDPNRVHTKHELLRDVWGYRADGRTRTLESHASRVRRALARAGADDWVSVTRGVGYRLGP